MKNRKFNAIDLTMEMVQIDSSNPGVYEGGMAKFLTKFFEGPGPARYETRSPSRP